MSEDVGDLIARRLVEIEEEAGKLERAIAHLRGAQHDPGGATRKASPRAKAKTAGGSGKIARRGRRAEEVLAYVEAHPDSTATLIAESIGTSPGNVHQVVRKLRGEGRLAEGSPLRLTS